MSASAAPESHRDRRPLFPMIALASVVVLLVAGVSMAAFNERLYAMQKVREATVQADILAATVAAPLAFDDEQAAQDYVEALAANPEIAAVGVYDERGARVASYQRVGETLPSRAAPGRPVFQGGRLAVTMPVVQEGDGLALGLVHLRVVVEPVGRRLGRYAGVGLLILMASVVLAVLGVGQAQLGRANAELRKRALDLADSNRQLQEQMAERAKAEEALRQSQKMEAIGRLTGGVAHDFNNLLMVASSGLDLLDRTEDPEKRERLKTGIRQAMERGAGLTSQLLAFSRRSALKPQVVDLAARVEGLRMLLDRSLREDIAVDLNLPEGLWPVEIDVNEFELAVLNIAVNARDAMPNGGLITIAASNEHGEEGSPVPGDFVCLTIKDTGEGMTEEVAARVFEPFFTTKGVGRGTGLGLSQVYGFARSSHGHVEAESRPGQGTTVSIHLPRSHKPLSAVEPTPGPRRAAGRAKGRVLMVEDDDAVASMVSQMLAQLGYRASRASTADAALKVLEADQKFDLVFSDMVMPGDMDGRALAREIRRLYPHLPVLLTTGYSEAAAQAAGDGLRLLMKPYRIDALAAAVKAARNEAGTSAASA